MSNVGERTGVLEGAVERGVFREVFSHVPTSIAVVAGFAENEGASGLAVGSLTSVSLEPPLVSFCVAAASTSWPRIRATGQFSVNVMARDQGEAVDAFASSGGDKFAAVDWYLSTRGLPVLQGAVGSIECCVEAEHPAGDHTIVIGRVLTVDIEPSRDPLVFYRRRYGGVHAT